VSFGSGIRRSLNEDYRQAQERDGVITSLEPRSLEDARQAIRTSNRKVLEAFCKDLAASGDGKDSSRKPTDLLTN
jgi:hypothetical protein